MDSNLYLKFSKFENFKLMLFEKNQKRTRVARCRVPRGGLPVSSLGNWSEKSCLPGPLYTTVRYLLLLRRFASAPVRGRPAFPQPKTKRFSVEEKLKFWAIFCQKNTILTWILPFWRSNFKNFFNFLAQLSLFHEGIVSLAACHLKFGNFGGRKIDFRAKFYWKNMILEWILAVEHQNFENRALKTPSRNLKSASQNPKP